MSENMTVVTTETNPAPEKFSIDYCLEQIEKIASQTEYLNQAIERLGDLANNENAGRFLKEAQVKTLTDIVRIRETTNQKLIAFYEKVYDDLKPRTSASREEVAARLTDALLNPTVPPDTKEHLISILKQYMQTL